VVPFPAVPFPAVDDDGEDVLGSWGLGGWQDASATVFVCLRMGGGVMRGAGFCVVFPAETLTSFAPGEWVCGVDIPRTAGRRRSEPFVGKPSLSGLRSFSILIILLRDRILLVQGNRTDLQWSEIEKVAK